VNTLYYGDNLDILRRSHGVAWYLTSPDRPRVADIT
jgi:hypothetical protein